MLIDARSRLNVCRRVSVARSLYCSQDGHSLPSRPPCDAAPDKPPPYPIREQRKSNVATCDHLNSIQLLRNGHTLAAGGNCRVPCRSVVGHAWTAPTRQGMFFGSLLEVGCKSCVRPVCAVPMTAGPDVIRRSGPYHSLALDSA